METDTKPDVAAQLASALGKIADGQAKLAETLDEQRKAAEELSRRLGKIEQTNDQAIKAAIDHAREQSKALKPEADPTDMEKQKAINAELQAKLEQADRDKEALRVATDLRKSEYSLGDIAQLLGAKAGIPGVRTKEMFGLLTSKAAESKLWQSEFPGYTPADVLMCGAFETKEVRYRVAGTDATFAIDLATPLTAGSEDEVLREAQRWSDAVYAWTLWKQTKNQHFSSIRECPFFKSFERAMGALAKAMTDTSLANWVPTGFSSQLIERYSLERNLTKVIQQVQMPQNPYDLPVRGGRLTIRKVTPSTTDPENQTGITSSAMTPLKTTLSLVDFAIRGVFGIDVEEDLIPAAVPTLIADMASSWAYGEEDLILNGDVGTFHQDVDSTGTYLNAWDGLRRMAVANSYTSNVAQTSEGLITTPLAAMGRYGARPSDMFAVVGPAQRASLLTLKNASGNFPLYIGSFAVGSIPNMATLGEIQSLAGSPLIVSEAMREDLNASGFYDGTTTNLRGLLWVNKWGPVFAYRNLAPRIVPNFETKTGQHEILLYVRREFEDAIPVATSPITTAAHHWVQLARNLS